MPKRVWAGAMVGALVLGLLADGASAAQTRIVVGSSGNRHGGSWERRHDRRDDWRGHRRDEWRDRHRHGGGGSGALFAVGALGLLAGAAIASSNRYDPPPAPIPYDDVDPYTTPYAGRDWHSYCARKFSTYDPRDGRYLAEDGNRYPCH